MDTFDSLSQFLADVNWLWFIAALLVAFGLGGVWYSLFFKNAWIRVFKIEMAQKVPVGNFIRVMGIQFAVNILFGLVFFILTGISVWLAVLVLIAVCAWQKGQLNFQFAKWSDFVMAATINVGYTFVAGLIFISFALIG